MNGTPGTLGISRMLRCSFRRPKGNQLLQGNWSPSLAYPDHQRNLGAEPDSMVLSFRQRTADRSKSGARQSSQSLVVLIGNSPIINQTNGRESSIEHPASGSHQIHGCACAKKAMSIDFLTEFDHGRSLTYSFTLCWLVTGP